MSRSAGQDSPLWGLLVWHCPLHRGLILEEIQKALKGLTLMSEDLEQVRGSKRTCPRVQTLGLEFFV